MKAKLMITLVTLGASTLLSGCATDDMSSLQSYVSEIKSRPGGFIEPLPEIKPAERYLYQSAGYRDPFSPAFSDDGHNDVVAIDSEQQRALHREVSERNKEELEQFELDGLRMVGTLEQTSALWGIVQDPEGTIYRVKEGNYLGKNYGKILSISEEKIQVREIVKDLQGAWEERKAAIAITDIDEA